jgi:acetyltransferase-like isoleucine patch superfamily enzyme
MPLPTLAAITRAWRCRRLRRAGVDIRYPRRLERHIDCRLEGQDGPGTISCGTGAWIEQGVVLHTYGGNIRLGRNIFLGPHVVIYGHGGVEIGDDTLIAVHCRIVSSNHTVPAIGHDIRAQPDRLLPVKIGRDVWLGAGVTVLGGVTIGDGCVVGAGAVVTKDLPPGAIARGVPATVQGWRDGATRT